MLAYVVNSRPQPREAARYHAHPLFPAFLTSFVSQPYKCPLKQTLSYHILTNARGVHPLPLQCVTKRIIHPHSFLD
jgi:hypothetical protein